LFTLCFFFLEITLCMQTVENKQTRISEVNKLGGNIRLVAAVTFVILAAMSI